MKTSRVLTTIVGLAAGGALLAGCAGDGGGNGDDGSANGGDGDSVRVAFVPKVQGVPFFEAMNAGAERAAADNPEIEWIYQGPTNADAAAQADVVRSMIQQQVDVLIVAPNDPDSMAPLIQEALDAGIRVATSDTDAPNSAREVFVSQASNEGIAHQIIDSLAEAMGEEGQWAIVSCGETAENLNAWIEIEREYAAENYPDMELVEVGYSGEDQAANAQMATDFMNAHPELTGLVGQCTTSAVGVAQAVRDAGRIDEVHTVGLGMPNEVRPYIKDGSAAASVLWDVEEFGYLTAWTGLQLGLGNDFEPVNNVSENLPSVEYFDDTNIIELGPALEINADNVDDFDY